MEMGQYQFDHGSLIPEGSGYREMIASPFLPAETQVEEQELKLPMIEKYLGTVAWLNNELNHAELPHIGVLSMPDRRAVTVKNRGLLACLLQSTESVFAPHAIVGELTVLMDRPYRLTIRCQTEDGLWWIAKIMNADKQGMDAQTREQMANDILRHAGWRPQPDVRVLATRIGWPGTAQRMQHLPLYSVLIKEYVAEDTVRVCMARAERKFADQPEALARAMTELYTYEARALRALHELPVPETMADRYGQYSYTDGSKPHYRGDAKSYMDKECQKFLAASGRMRLLPPEIVETIVAMQRHEFASMQVKPCFIHGDAATDNLIFHTHLETGHVAVMSIDNGRFGLGSLYEELGRILYTLPTEHLPYLKAAMCSPDGYGLTLSQWDAVYSDAEVFLVSIHSEALLNKMDHPPLPVDRMYEFEKGPVVGTIEIELAGCLESVPILQARISELHEQCEALHLAESELVGYALERLMDAQIRFNTLQDRIIYLEYLKVLEAAERKLYHVARQACGGELTRSGRNRCDGQERVTYPIQRNGVPRI